MSFAYPEKEQALVASIIRQPAFKRVVDIPLIAWQQVLLVVAAYTTVFGGIALHLNGLWPYPLLLLTSGIASYAAFTPLHDATHRSVSSNPWLNDLIGTIFAQLLITGGTVSVYRFLHLEHHRHTGDPERDPDEGMVSGSLPKRLITIAFIELHWLRWYLKHSDQRATKAKALDALSLIFVPLWLGAWLVSPYAMEFLLLFLLPQRIGVLITGYLFASIQHPEGMLEYQQPLQATRMFKGGWLAHISMISQSQHLMHHLFPMVPYYRYNRAWQLSKPVLKNEPLIWDWPVGKRKMPSNKAAVVTKQTLTVRIAAVEAVADGVCAYTFESCDGTALPSYKPGAHIDVHIGDSAGGETLIRQYSLTGIAAEGSYSIAVKREASGRGGSKRLHEQFAVGHQLEISLPRNLFELDPDDKHALLVAGGIGITPLLSMAQHLHQRGRSFDFYIAARSQALLPFSEWLAQQPWVNQQQLWLGDNALSAEALSDYQPGHRLYLCGPEGFMHFVREQAASRGWPEAAIRSEAFSAAPSAANNRSFTVELGRSGKTIEVPADSSLLDALQAHQISITASCVQGLCGTCSCRVLEGDVEHRDQFYSDQEHAQGLMTSCVSRAAGSRLLLDL